MSGLAALLPASTISLYLASKVAAFGLYRALAVENPSIAFTYLHLAFDRRVTADGVDPNSYEITGETFANRVVEAVDKGERGFPSRYEECGVLDLVPLPPLNANRYGYLPMN